MLKIHKKLAVCMWKASFLELNNSEVSLDITEDVLTNTVSHKRAKLYREETSTNVSAIDNNLSK